MKSLLQQKKTILVTGSNGQLGKELQQISNKYACYNFLFTTKENLPIEDYRLVEKYFETQKINYCINCAAYTAVDKAESEKEKAFLINATATGNLAETCNKYNTPLIHISTDYVFDGNATLPYNEEHPIAPVNIYGASKLKGEELALGKNAATTVIRTSWVYSSFGNNFVKTMLRFMNEKESVGVINDQFGCPTYAADLAEVIIKIIDGYENNNTPVTGIFNFCNTGVTTWYQFALAIKSFARSNCAVNPIPSSQYATAAKRPRYSVLDTSKIQKLLGISIPFWKDSLEKCLSIPAYTQPL